MPKLGDLTFTGASRRTYLFEVYEWNTQFNAVGAVYAITRFVVQAGTGGRHTLVYIGETGNLSTRFDNHHRATCFRREQASHICVHVDNDERSRRSKEADLIEYYDPVCNRE